MIYTTSTLVQKRLNRELTPDETSYLNDSLLPAISDYINRYTGTKFGSDAYGEEEVVYVDGSDGETGLKELLIPTMHSITEVAEVGFDGALRKEVTDYAKNPRGKAETFSIYRQSEFPHGRDNIRVSGRIGYKDVPGDIELAATMAAATVLEHKSQLTSESVGDWSVSYAKFNELIPQTVTDILDQYKRMSLNI